MKDEYEMQGMLRIAMGVFLVLHGLVHFWFVVLSRRLVPYEEAMGWSGQSWVFSSFLPQHIVLALATGLFAVSAIAFVGGGLGYVFETEWWKTLLVIAAVLSTVTIVMFWDGSFDKIVEKGVLGVLINLAVIALLYWQG